MNIHNWISLVNVIVAFCCLGMTYRFLKHMRKVGKRSLVALRWIDKELDGAPPSLHNHLSNEDLSKLPKVAYLVGYLEGLEAVTRDNVEPSEAYKMICEVTGSLKDMGVTYIHRRME